jgi:hypothetical protein
VTGKRYNLTNTPGTSVSNVTSAQAVSATYGTQWKVTFAATGLGSDATGTVVAVTSGGTISAAQLGTTAADRWVNNNGSIAYTYTDPVSSTTVGKQYNKTSGPTPASPISNIASPQSVTAGYDDRYPTTVTNVTVSAKPPNTQPQYSDTVTLSATVNAANTTSGALSGTVTFLLNGKPVSPALTATVSGGAPQTVTADLRLTTAIIPLGSGSYSLTAAFAPAAGSKYLSSSGTASPQPQIQKEDMTLAYTGLPFVNTAKAGGTVVLSVGASVTEDAAELGDKSWSSIPLQVQFQLLDGSANPISGKTCTATVAQTAGQVLTGTGGASCSPGTVGGGTYGVQVTLLTNGYYTSDVGDFTVTVADPGTGFITGGGWVVLPNNDRGNFGFNAKFLKNGQIQGNSLFIYRTTANLAAMGVVGAPAGLRSYNYIVKANALDGLRTCGVLNQIPCAAQLTGKSNIKAIDRQTGLAYNIDSSVIGNQQMFEIDAIDNGEPGSSPGIGPDIYALKVFTSSGPFLTVGTPAYPGPTAMQISGGNVQVRP